ncbi:hypothetical protein ACP70R_016760 [Stipagrostis hirtigluma subsp. patula]
METTRTTRLLLLVTGEIRRSRLVACEAGSRGGRHDGVHAAQQLHPHHLAGHIVRQRRGGRRGRRVRARAQRHRLLPGTDGLVGPPLGANGLRASGSSSLSCATGDCGGAVSCTLGGVPPVTVAEFTLGGADGKDFYDVSLVDGYNVGIGVAATGARVNYATCGYAGCVGDVNALCPPELQVAGNAAGAGQGETAPPASTTTVACRSACEAFGAPEYCCTGAHGGPGSCGPSRYSRLFKAACPAAYSYAYDDPTSTFTCGAGAQYLVTFCPGHQ